MKSNVDVPGKVEFAQLLFRFLEDRNVEYAVVGDARNYEMAIEGDIDLAVSECELVRMPVLVRDYCAEHGGRLVQVLRHEASAWYFVVVIGSKRGNVFLHPDVCADYVRGARPLLRASDLLDERRRSESGFWIPGPVSGFAYYLIKKLDKGSIDARQFEYLAELRQQDRSGVDAWLHQTFKTRRAKEVIHDLTHGEIRALQGRLPTLRTAVISHRPIRIADRIAEMKRYVDRITRPTGVMVAFLGPDGVGKSSVIAEVERQVAPVFRRTARFHLRPHVGQKSLGSVAVTSPHAAKPRGVLASIVKVLLWWFDYVSGYVGSMYPRLIRSTLVIFDRYADDLAIDPKRYRYGGPLWLGRLLARAVPQPDLGFVLVAAPEVIQARKAEVSLAETVRQVGQYRDLAKRKGMVLVDVGRPLEEVAEDIVEEVLSWLEERTHKRLGLKP